MKPTYIAIVVFIGVIIALSANRKNVAIAFALTAPFLPNYINAPIGSVNIWGADILAIVILVLVLVFSLPKSPTTLLPMDFLLPAACLWVGVGYLANGETLDASFQRMSRWMIPWVIPYFIGRFGVTSWEGFKKILRAMVFLGLLLTILAGFEAFTGRNVLNALFGFGWNPGDVKFGLFRSGATFTSFHIFGMYMATISILSMGFFLSSQGQQSLYLICFFVLALGTFFATASTGVMLGLAGLAFLTLYPIRGYWKFWLYGFIVLNIVIHFLSKDGIHFFYTRRMIGFGEAYYRAVLIDTVLEQMPGHWLFGHGDALISVWFVSYEDICNNWLLFLVRGGLPSFLCLVAFFFLMLLRLRACYDLIQEYRGERILIWAILGTLVGTTLAWFFIALFSSDIGVFSFYFGMIVTLPDLARKALQNRSEPLAIAPKTS